VHQIPIIYLPNCKLLYGARCLESASSQHSIIGPIQENIMNEVKKFAEASAVTDDNGDVYLTVEAGL
jgi:hypothetical protein